MVRNVFVQRKVLELYQRMDSIYYPIQPETLLPCVSQSCRIMSYQKLAEVAGCSVEDVAVLCKSNSGATHFDIEQNRYLILYNEAMNAGRVRWTLGHEIGHICVGHLEAIGEAVIAFTEHRGFYNQFESEADYFAWNLLAPLPILREMGIRSGDELKTVYGLSTQAAALQYDRYVKWCRSHTKTAWENDMLRAFRSKYAKERKVDSAICELIAQ